jgi:hypothetical protein
MSECPYPEFIINPISGEHTSNTLYLAWHYGYEAHKFELANHSIKLANLAVELELEVQNVMKLKKAMQKQRANQNRTD